MTGFEEVPFLHSAWLHNIHPASSWAFRQVPKALIKDCKPNCGPKAMPVGGLWGSSLCIKGQTGQSDPESKRRWGAHPFSLEARSSVLSVSAAALRAHLDMYRIHSAVKNVIPKIPVPRSFLKSGKHQSSSAVGSSMTPAAKCVLFRRPLSKICI